MKINDIINEDLQITAMDPNDPKKPVTLTDPTTKVTTTYPDASHLKAGPNGVTIDPNAQADQSKLPVPKVGDTVKTDPNAKPVAEQRGKAPKAHVNFTPEDLSALNHIKDLDELKHRAFELISNEGPASMQPEKIAYFKDRLGELNSRMAVIKMMYDMLLSGEGLGVMGSRHSTDKNAYRNKFVDEDQDENDSIQPGRRNPSIGGNPANSFIRDVQDPKFTKSARGVSESAELTAMLTIAGLR